MKRRLPAALLALASLGPAAAVLATAQVGPIEQAEQAAPKAPRVQFAQVTRAAALAPRDDSYPPELPPAERVRAAIADAPDVHAAAAMLEAALADRRRLVVGPHEWSTRADYQRRRVHEVGANDRFNEWSLSLERGVRLPGKAELDRRLGTERITEAEIALGDARHEASRRLLGLWYAMLRERESAHLLAHQAELAAREAAGVARRRELGDASQLDEMQASADAEQAEAARRVAADLAERAAVMLAREFPILADAVPPQALPAPPEPAEDLAALAQRAIEENHALRGAQAAAASARTEAQRAIADRRPDPTMGVQYGSERGGGERILGVYVSIPFGGEARRAQADASVARAAASGQRAEAQRRQVDADVASLLSAARSGVARWQAAQRSAQLQANAAERVARARELGEADLAEVLRARRLALDAALRAQGVQVDALESRARLLLDAHQLWDFEPEE
ncbi:MAG: TolC family protein [Burkholderiaceae bacterium]|nr:TolC family protein [Burkholderiaceae bacterium]